MAELFRHRACTEPIRMRRALAVAAGVSGLAGVIWVTGWKAGPDAAPDAARAGRRAGAAAQEASARLRVSLEDRQRALRNATVWQPPAAPIEGADLERDPEPLPRELSCRFVVDVPRGTTPKFECELETGEIVKVKYTGPEPHGEVAASRLLRALGFGADSVTFVDRLRCHGCPRFPFLTMKAIGATRSESLYRRTVDYTEFTELGGVSVERKRRGIAIETADGRGWAWFELETLQAAPRAEVDALRLMAAFLVHWDNKAENQRLLCPETTSDGDGPSRLCDRPLAYMQDLGATFGPRKVHLDNWRRTPVWHDRATCQVSMEDLPHGGGTFPPVRISEPGRRFLAERLTRLRRPQVEALFRGARFPEHDGEALSAWVDVFEQKVGQVADGPACPES
jgi:hypothetical protein